MGIMVNCFIIFLIVVNLGDFSAFGASFLKTDGGDDKETKTDSNLKFLIVVTRHGNRPPLYGLANDQYPKRNKTYWPYGDTLTKVGRQEMYNMGVKLRSLYKGFLGNQFFDNEVRVSSTNVDRVIQSAQLLLAGLYPPKNKQIWNKSLIWQPVPIHLDSLDKTQLSSRCKKFNTLQAVVKAAYATKWAENITYFTEYVSEAMNNSLSGTFGALQIWDSLLSEDVEGFSLPDWAAQVYPDAMYPMMNDMYVQYVAGTDELVRLVIGPFFAEMMDVIESKIDGTMSPDRKLYFWSGHDDTLITLQAALGLAQDKIIGVVNPASTMVFEVHQNKKNKNYFLKAFYIDGKDSSSTPVTLKIPNCGSPCMFNKFKKHAAKYTNITSENYNQECSS